MNCTPFRPDTGIKPEGLGISLGYPYVPHVLEGCRGLAKKRGVRLGPPIKETEEHRLLAISMFEQGKTIAEIVKACGVSAGAIVQRVREWREDGRFPEGRRRPKGRKLKSEDHDRGMRH